MPTVRARPNGTFELRVTHRLLPKPYYSTHDSDEAANAYGDRLIEELDRGRLPPELLPRPKSLALSTLIDEYRRTQRVATSDGPMLDWIKAHVDVGVEGITVRWVDDWVQQMKRRDRLAPGSIRKKVESLARVIDWHLRRTHQAGAMPSNPLRTLPRGYSVYADADVGDDEDLPTDASRDRRLGPKEEPAIEQVLAGNLPRSSREAPGGSGKAPVQGAEMLLLFRLLLHTALRLREAYRLRAGDVRFDVRTIHVARSKTGRARDVPMTPEVCALLEHVRDASPGDLVFPFWNGDPDEEVLKRTSTRLSQRFATAFGRAGCADLTAHDLRHEATCRWMLMKDTDGRWMFRPEEVRRITGHKSVQMFERYLSLRGSDLAERL